MLANEHSVLWFVSFSVFVLTKSVMQSLRRSHIVIAVTKGPVQVTGRWMFGKENRSRRLHQIDDGAESGWDT